LNDIKRGLYLVWIKLNLVINEGSGDKRRGDLRHS
jgi:hypothetical protein